MAKRFRSRPSSRRAAKPEASWLVLGYQHAREVARGERKVHILPVRSSDHRKRYHENLELAVKGFVGGPTEARVIVTEVQRIPLREVDFKTARAFGARHLDDFREKWTDEHGGSFEKRWKDRDVWVVWFKRDPTRRPRFLAAESDELYVDTPARAMRDEFPALYDEEFEQHIGKPSKSLAVEREKRRKRDVELLTDDERLAAVKRDAARRGINISQELRHLSICRPGRSPVGIIEAIERKVYRVAA